MSAPTERFDGLSREHREFWCVMAGAAEFNGDRARIAIDTWRGQGMTAERATLEFIAWLIVARERLGMQGYGTA